MPYFVVLQADLLDSLATVIVAPAIPVRERGVIARLNPQIEVDGKPLIVTMQDMAAIPRSRLSPVVANVADQHEAFVAAIDLLFTGI